MEIFNQLRFAIFRVPDVFHQEFTGFAFATRPLKPEWPSCADLLSLILMKTRKGLTGMCSVLSNLFLRTESPAKFAHPARPIVRMLQRLAHRCPAHPYAFCVLAASCALQRQLCIGAYIVQRQTKRERERERQGERARERARERQTDTVGEGYRSRCI